MMMFFSASCTNTENIKFAMMEYTCTRQRIARIRRSCESFRNELLGVCTVLGYKTCKKILVLNCSLQSRRGLVQEDKRMAFVYTHGLFIT